MLVKALGMASNTGQTAITPSFLLNETTLINCGGIGGLTPSELAQIDIVFLSNSGAEYSRFLPLLAEAHVQHSGGGFTLYAQQETLDALHETLFNGTLHPDYTRVASAHGPSIARFHAIEIGESLPLPDGIATPLPAEHTLPTIGWLIEGEWRALALPGEGEPCHSFWQWVSSTPSLTDIVCELPTLSGQPQTTEHTHEYFLSHVQPFLSLLPPNSQLWLYGIAPENQDDFLAEVKTQMSNSFIRAEILQHNAEIEL